MAHVARERAWVWHYSFSETSASCCCVQRGWLETFGRGTDPSGVRASAYSLMQKVAEPAGFCS